MGAMQQMMLGAGARKYATWDPGAAGSGLSVISANLVLFQNDSNLWNNARSTIGKSSGKWYWEYTFSSSPSYVMAGISNGSSALGPGASSYPGSDSNAWSYYAFDGNKRTNAVSTAYGVTWTSETIGVALDMDSGTVTMYVNNASQGTMYSGLTGTIYAFAGLYLLSASVGVNFGASPFTYTPPTGFNSGLYE